MTAKEAIQAALTKAQDAAEIIKPKQADAPKGGGGEANAQEESLQEHIKHWHKNVAPAKPCEWMIKHGYGGAAANANTQNGVGASGAPDAGAAAQAQAQAQAAAANVEQPKPTALSNEMGTVKSLSPQFSAWCEKMGQRYEAETDPVKKQRIANIYFGLQKKYGGEVKKTPDQIKTEIDKTKQDFAANKERVAAIRKEKEQDVWQQYKNGFEELKGQLKRGEITEKQFDRKETKLERTLDKGLADLKEISDEDLLKQDDDANAKNKADAEKFRKAYAPKQRENASDGAKKLQNVLGGIGAKRDAAQKTADNIAPGGDNTLVGKFGDDKDNPDPEFVKEMEDWYASAETPEEKQNVEEHYKRWLEAGKPNPNRKPYAPKTSQDKQPSEKLATLRKVLGFFETTGGYAKNVLKGRANIIQRIKKWHDDVYGTSEWEAQQKAKGEGGQPQATPTPQLQPKYDALQRHFGELDTENLQPEAKSWLSDIEGRFAKAQPAEQLKILGEYRKGMKLWGFKTKQKKTEGEVNKMPPTQTAQAKIPKPGELGYAGTAQTKTQQDLLNKILAKDDE